MKEKESNEQLISQMEEVIKQLRQAQEETSAAAAVADAGVLLQSQAAPVAESSSGSRVRVGSLFRFRRLKWAVGVVALALMAYGGYTLFGAAAAKPTVATFVSGVKDIATLATAEAYVMTTVDGSDNKLFGMNLSFDLPGTKRTYLFVVPAKMLAGVDLKGLTSDDVVINHEAKTIELTLPHATFVQESIQMDKLQVYTDSGLLRANLDTKEGIDIIKQGQVMEKLREEANTSGILQTAEKNAERALQSLYQDLGYAVTVKYK